VAYIVVEDFGQFGRAFRETDLAEADLGTIVRNMISGEYRDPPRAEAVVDRWNRRGFWLRHAASITFSFTRCLVTPANESQSARSRQSAEQESSVVLPAPRSKRADRCASSFGV
jgi:hypothetical protein